jgi:hypothetical protein
MQRILPQVCQVAGSVWESHVIKKLGLISIGESKGIGATVGGKEIMSLSPYSKISLTFSSLSTK